MQKLNFYTQSSQQDVRSFCNELRELFKEVDPQMSATMKLELFVTTFIFFRCSRKSFLSLFI
jgi:hypothetical protein